MLPASWIGIVPRERPMPKSAYALAPLSRMKGIAANDSTLLITVGRPNRPLCAGSGGLARTTPRLRSEEHTSELQSRGHLVCRLLLEKKQKQIYLPLFRKKKKINKIIL